MQREKHPWIYDVLVIAVLAVAAFLRLSGADWGELQHQHPDELFLTGVLANLRAHECMDDSVPIDACPPEQQRWIGLDDYFDTKTSTLNPHNRGFAFFVYGTLPMFIIRYTAELTGQTDYGQLKLLGRQFSALADLGTILLLYVIAARLYNRRTALLAAAFSAFAAMQIQQSHFFTTDLFVNLFSFLAIYFAVGIVESREQRVENSEENSEERAENKQLTPRSPLPTLYSQLSTPNSLLPTLYSLLSHPLFSLSLAFGLSFGLALASKVNIYPLAFLLPAAFLLRYFTIERKKQTADEKPPSEPKEQPSAARFLQTVTTDYWSLVTVCLVVGGLAAFLAFRVFQPYAFDGLLPNQQWLDNIAEQRVQARGDADLPWNLQWARRTHLYSFTNLTVWGLGLPLGILAWAGFLVMGWRILKGERQHLLPWGWTAFYITWQSLQFNPTMRYQLPIYPLLALMAAWVVFELVNASSSRITHYALRTVGLLVLAATAIWAFAFQSVYTREETRLAASRWIYQNVPAPINLHIQLADGSVYNQPVSFPSGSLILPGSPYGTTFSAVRDGLLTEVSLGYLADTLASGPQTLSLLVANAPDPTPEQTLARSALTGDFAPADDPRGAPATLALDPPLQVKEGEIFFLHFETTGGALTLSGATIANETDYDYSLPFRTEYDGFGGIYRGDLNFQVYWDDNADKLARFTETLDQTDYILIPTNHQYAQITRLPERYPLTTVYYRELLGCPPERNIIACYREAEPGMFEGRLGFELVKTFTSYPTLGPLVINDQAAEEAFTFYDHPKVMIFQKRADYDPAAVRAILGSVDLTNVVHLTPREASTYKDLMLSAESLAVQRAGGTWSDLFDYDHLQNKYPLIGLLVWYFFVLALGALTWPVIRLALPGLGQGAWPLARTLGLVILAYVPWLLGSLGVPYSRGTIGLVLAAITVAGLGLGWMRRDDLATEWKSNRRYFLTVEAVFLSFFLFDLLIRLGNPDLWHPAKGGERPMDFSYFNAVLKSTTFPPYDPWFAGGYINYYYYGFVLVGTPVKLLGIVPSIAYNFLLPTWFALTAVNAFAVGSTLVGRGVGSRGLENRGVESSEVEKSPSSLLSAPYSLLSPLYSLSAGLASALLMTTLGNLGTIQMVFQALARIAAPGGSIADSHFFQRLSWAGEGLYKTIAQGVVLPIGRGEWYWNPSRVIPPGPGNEITEFPFFTFLYSDLHAHMIVMPLALFVVAWALGTVLARRTSLLSLAVGALVIGALYPANLSDMYTYLPVGLTALAYALWRADEGALPRWPVVATSVVTRRLFWIALSIAILTALSFGFYSPYRAAYSQAYSKLDPWTATQTPLTSYLTHWGLFLFIIFAWLAWETREWMAATPVSALNKLKPFQLLIELALALFIVALLYLAYRKIWIGWIALPMAVWAGLLLLRPQLADTKRLALFWIGTALAITLVVELVTVRGDIGRMNTIFKFYLQAWALLSVSAGAAFVWALADVHKWRLRWRNAWQGGVIILVSGALLFTVTATTDKVNDRINQDAPHSFDTMEYMAHSEYWDAQTMDLSQDYRAIRWMQDNVQGSPVIVETNCPEYRWCSRFTIYTGLPGVVGWNWHQRQQRALTPPNLITDRVDAIGAFYHSTDPEFARAFLAQYDVRYIIVGQLEAIYYPDGGLAKFEQFDGTLWKSVYHDAQTTIYEVLP
jgi:YYY domain-containing protein